jgi:hypothetical protein
MPSLQGRAEKAAAGPSGVATTTSRGRSASGETARRWPNLKKHGPAWHSWGGAIWGGRRAGPRTSAVNVADNIKAAPDGLFLLSVDL